MAVGDDRAAALHYGGSGYDFPEESRGIPLEMTLPDPTPRGWIVFMTNTRWDLIQEANRHRVERSVGTGDDRAAALHYGIGLASQFLASEVGARDVLAAGQVFLPEP